MGEDLGERRGARCLAVLWVLALLPSLGDGILSLLSPWSCLLTVSLLVPIASGLGEALLWGLGHQKHGTKGALTLGLKSLVCPGGHLGPSISGLWTGPGLAEPGKNTAHLEA